MKTLFNLLVMFFFMTFSVHSQIDVKGKIKSASLNRANQKTDQAIDKGLDEAEKGVTNAVKGDQEKENSEEAETKDKDESSPDAEAENEDNADKDNVKKEATPKLESYSKYDFIPGEKVIFYEDFSQDAIGDFPALWNTNGSAEVVTTNLFPGQWMKFSTDEAIWTDQLLNLPENYTIEMDIIPTNGEDNDNMRGYVFRMIQSINLNSIDAGSVPGKAGFMYNVAYYGISSYRAYTNGSSDADALDISGQKDGDMYKQFKDHKYHIAIWVQKSRLRLYMDEKKLFDLPKAFPFASAKMDRLRFEEGAAMVSNIRIAVGNPDMRNKLLTEGKLVSYGIYFDVNKDVVKPESYGTLKTIAAVLTENPDVKIKIVGHTDSDGADAANLDLSKRRGAAVKDELVKSFAIDASRIETDGKGETVPIAPNDSPANKALNRRVEFIKL
jgi:outer membrane protein OmpA-like peptidoglycan-associated protein